MPNKLLVLFLATLAASVSAGVQDCVVGLTAMNGDVAVPDVYDSSQMYPVRDGFKESQCTCSESQCKTRDCNLGCHLESTHLDTRFFYLQHSGSSGDLSLMTPNVTFTPLCDTDGSAITLETAAIVHKYVLQPEELTPIEVSFICKTLSRTPKTGIFDIQVSVPVRNTRSSSYETITWFFRKACATEPDPIDGLDISFGKHTVVSNGVVTSSWRSSARNAFDVGFDYRTKDVTFDLTFRSRSVGSIMFDMFPPEFDETVVKSVTYKGNQFTDTRRTNVISSGSSSRLTVSVACQSRPHLGVGDVIVGLTNVVNLADEKPLRAVEFKFEVECPQRGRHITPLGILLIVSSLFVIVGFMGGYAYNITFTSNRGLAAVPLLPDLIKLVRRKPKRYDDVDDSYLLDDEEIRATVARDDANAYGTIQ